MSPSKDHPMETIAAAVSAPKVAMGIKGFSLAPKAGSKPISFATRNPNAASLPSSSVAQNTSSKPSSHPGYSSSPTLGKRTRAQLHNYSDEDEEEVRHEEVTGFDIRVGGALKKNDEPTKEPLVIPRLKTRDWREEIKRARKGRNLLPPEVQAQRRAAAQGKDGVETNVEGDGVVKWGLTITKKAVTTEGDANIGDAQRSHEDAKTEVETTEVLVEQPREKTDDELALEALMGKQNGKKGPDLVIPKVAANDEDDDEYTRPRNEEDAYRRAIQNAPDVSTLEDYERVPVEEFGAALLRGMGWKEGDAKKGRIERPKEVKRRQNLLGLGATELKGVEELGAWVQKSDPKRLGSGNSRGHERRPKANEYREREVRKRESRDDRYGSHRRDRDDYRDRDRDRVRNSRR
jgi:hypothetical protein